MTNQYGELPDLQDESMRPLYRAATDFVKHFMACKNEPPGAVAMFWAGAEWQRLQSEPEAPRGIGGTDCIYGNPDCPRCHQSMPGGEALHTDHCPALNRQEHAMQALADQAQELELGYGSVHRDPMTLKPKDLTPVFVDPSRKDDYVPDGSFAKPYRDLKEVKEAGAFDDRTKQVVLGPTVNRRAE